jgi:hypothetical protein
MNPNGQITEPDEPMNEREIRYRREQAARDREQREARHAERQQEVEDALWRSLTAAEQRLWRAFSDAVGRVRPLST